MRRRGSALVVAAPALAHPRARAVDRQAGREHEVGGDDGVGPEGPVGVVGRIVPVEVEVRQGDREEHPDAARRRAPR